MSNIYGPNANIQEVITVNGLATTVDITSAGVTTTATISGQTVITNYNNSCTLVTQSNDYNSSYILNQQYATIMDVALDIPDYPFGDTYFNTVVLRSYLDVLISTATVQTLDNLYTYKYFNDFYGILNELGINPRYHPITLRMNNITDTGLYNPNITSILIPNTSTIDQIASVFVNTSG